jgi:hypothetical protein
VWFVREGRELEDLFEIIKQSEKHFKKIKNLLEKYLACE